MAVGVGSCVMRAIYMFAARVLEAGLLRGGLPQHLQLQTVGGVWPLAALCGEFTPDHSVRLQCGKFFSVQLASC